jgi:hypothetical protein
VILPPLVFPDLTLISGLEKSGPVEWNSVDVFFSGQRLSIDVVFVAIAASLFLLGYKSL